MRLLLVADVSPVVVLGGGERVLREHALRLHKRGHEVTVLCRAPGPDAPEQRPSPPSQVNSRIHRHIDEVCLKALDPDPALRYETAGDLAA
ncbi:MAG: glycosyltransferase, partial [candidate division NC10 bacterium]